MRFMLLATFLSVATAADPAQVLPGQPAVDADTAWIHSVIELAGSSLPFSVMVAAGKAERARVGHGGMLACDPTKLVVAEGAMNGEMIVGFSGPDQRSMLVPLAWRTPIAIDLTWTGETVTGTAKGRFPGSNRANALPSAETSGKVTGRRLAGKALRDYNGLADGAAWPNYLGPDQRFSARPGTRPWLADPTKGRLAWVSQYIGPTESGSKRYGPCVGTLPAAGGASPVVAYGRVYQFRYVASGETISEAHVAATLADPEKKYGTVAKMAEIGWTEADLKARWRISADEELLCLDAATGKTLWTARWPDEGLHFYDHKCCLTNWTPAVADGTVYVLGGTGRLRAVDAATGTVRWQIAVPGLADSLGKMKDEALKAKDLRAPTRSFCHAVATAADLVLVPDGNGPCGIVAIDAATGEVRWRAAQMLPGAAAMPLTFIDAGKTFVVGVGSGKMTAIDATDGKVAWTSTEVGDNEYQAILVGNRLIANAMKAADRKVESAAFPEEKRSAWEPAAVLSAPGENFGQVGCWKLTANGAEKLWITPTAWGAPWYTPIGAATEELLCTRGRYRYHLIKIADGSRIASSVLSEPARWDEGHLFAVPGVFFLQPDSQHGHAKFYPFPAQADAVIAPVWHPPFPATTTYQVGMSHAWADGRMFIRGKDALYCYDLRGP
ncbi:hypothetical protein LBMAG53_07700 [Planctomycetota bacterium]|nr:hypothetical protein LBMAG53_07700 [Planctomycetota bacterium]